MPPGGHLEPDEDPVTAVLREIGEETGLTAEVLPLAPTFAFAYPGQVAPPFTILLEDSAEPGQRHQHIDLIYFCRPADGSAWRTRHRTPSWPGWTKRRCGPTAPSSSSAAAYRRR